MAGTSSAMISTLPAANSGEQNKIETRSILTIADLRGVSDK
jgi:hypothetical protein